MYTSTGSNNGQITSLWLVSIGRIIIVRRATRGGRGEASPAVFQKSKKRCPDFRKKGLHCVHPYVKFTIQNVVLRVSKRKTSQFFLTGPFFLEFLTIRLSECPNFTKPPLPWKIFGCAPDCYYRLILKSSIKITTIWTMRWETDKRWLCKSCKDYATIEY